MNNSQFFSYTFQPRVLADGTSVALNKGLVGFGSNNSRGVLDNLVVATVRTVTLDTTEDFSDGLGQQLTGPTSGTWTVSAGRDAATAPANGTSVTTADLGTNIDSSSFVDLTSTLSSTGTGGIAFDAYATNDFKFAALDVVGQRVIVGHVDPKRGWVDPGLVRGGARLRHGTTSSTSTSRGRSRRSA